jgi:hypothetical protein
MSAAFVGSASGIQVLDHRAITPRVVMRHEASCANVGRGRDKVCRSLTDSIRPRFSHADSTVYFEWSGPALACGSQEASRQTERRIMLPFTKRPGRDESGDEDVVTRDDVVVKPSNAPPTGGRGKLASINDEEMTTLMHAKTVGDALANAVAARAASPRPAAGAPPPSHPAPSSRPGPGSIPPPAQSRPGKFVSQEASDDDDGRTIVRGNSPSVAPKIVKRSNSTMPPNSSRAAATGASAKMGGNTLPTTISPAAVIKATLESARAGVKPRTDHLMAGPPQDLLEDLADIGKPSPHPADVGAEHTAILKAPHSNAPPPMIQGVKALSTQMMQPQGIGQGTIPPGSSRSMSSPPPANQSGGYAAQSGGYAAQSGGYAAQYSGPVPSGSVSVPGVAMPQSMPAHFMTAHAPYSDARVDPPGTAVTSRMKVGGRPAMSWALALAAFGIFVGVGAVAVLNGNDGAKETSASFVDPSRAGGNAARNAAAAQAATPTPTGVPVANGTPAANEPAPAVGVPAVAVPAAAAPAAATDTVAAPSVTTPAVAVAAAPAPAPTTAIAAAAPAAAAPAPAPRPAAVAAAAPRPAAAAPAAAPRPSPRPAPQPAAASDDAPVAAAPTAKGGKGGKGAAGKGGGEMDDETKKALDELQKAQLERSF